MESSPTSPLSQAHFTSTGIPIRNVWHMLVYAWTSFRDLRAIHRGQFESEQAPTLDALLAQLLAQLIEQRLRVGLARQYVPVVGMIRGLKGRIDFGESLKRRDFEQGRAFCRYEELSADTPSNRILRGTLERMARVAEFGPDDGFGLRTRLRKLTRVLDTAEPIVVETQNIRRQRLHKHDPDYQLMLAICELFWESRIPNEDPERRALLALDPDALTLSFIYEQFVAEFYKMHLLDWKVWSQKQLAWPDVTESQLMPVMRPDLVLEQHDTGQRVVLDTKFTARSLVESQFGSGRFDSHHLYQVYSYLRTQEQREIDRGACGVLLYPAVRWHLDEIVIVQGHRIRIATVDLSKDWLDIEKQLKQVVSFPIPVG